MNIRFKFYIFTLVIALCLIFSPEGNDPKERLLLSSLSQVRPVDRFDNIDFFPDYHEVARKICKVQKAIKNQNEREILTDEVISEDDEWLIKSIILPYEVLNCDLPDRS